MYGSEIFSCFLALTIQDFYQKINRTRIPGLVKYLDMEPGEACLAPTKSTVDWGKTSKITTPLIPISLEALRRPALNQALVGCLEGCDLLLG
jgi:hypothetical protein